MCGTTSQSPLPAGMPLELVDEPATQRGGDRAGHPPASSEIVVGKFRALPPRRGERQRPPRDLRANSLARVILVSLRRRTDYRPPIIRMSGPAALAPFPDGTAPAIRRPSAITGPVPTIRTSAGHWRCSAPSGTACGRKRPRHRARVAAQQAAASRSCPSERRARRGVNGLYRGVDATSAQCLQTCRRHRRRRRLGRRGVVVRFPPATAPRNVVGRSTGLDGDPPLRPPEPRSTIAC